MISHMIIALVFPLINGAPDNAGTEFVIGFMQNLAHGTDCDIELFVTTSSKRVVEVTVQAPRSNTLSLNKKVSVTSGQVQKIIIDRGFQHQGTELQSKGILISSSEETVIFGINKQVYSNDGYLGLPTDVLGKEYIAACYSPIYNYTSVLIVGVHDGSHVSVLLPNDNNVQVTYEHRRYVKNEWINITLNRFDSFQIQTLGDLTGTRIISNHVIAVFSGNVKTNIGIGNTKDHLVEQLFPVSTFGKSFATVPIPGRSTGDLFRFIASKDNTHITVSFYKSGTTRSARNFVIPKANSYVEKDFESSWYTHVVASEPILVVQYVKSGVSRDERADPAMILIPPIEQYAADYTFSTPQYSLGDAYINYVMFVVPKSEKDDLLLNDKHLPSSTIYHEIPDTVPRLVGGFININEGTYTFRHTSPITLFCAILFGRQTMESYAFPIGLRLAPINEPCHITMMVRGDGLDNDCDGLIDEERCFPVTTDDDNDGKTNEDCAKLSDAELLSTPQVMTSENLDVTTDSSLYTTDLATQHMTSEYMTSQSLDETTTDYPETTKAIRHISTTHSTSLATQEQKYEIGAKAEYPETTPVNLPSWFRYLEISMVSGISIIAAGVSICFCKKCFAFGKRPDDDEDDEEGKKKYSRLRQNLKQKLAKKPKGWVKD